MIKKKIGIVGGGASGLMAAVAAATASGRTNPEDIVILEKKDRIGKKLLVTGNGKCNLTNLSFSAERVREYYRGGSPGQLAEMFARFGVREAMEQFERLGLLLTSRNGYIYPLSQQASSVLDAFRFELERLGVCAETDCAVRQISRQRTGCYLVECDRGEWQFERLILSCGTPAGEKKGEGLDGYRFASRLGHTVLGPWPALVQLRCEGDFWKGLAGVRCEADITLTVSGRKRSRQWSERGELQLTDYGISGIPVFQLSRHASLGLSEGGEVTARIDFLPCFQENGQDWERFVEGRLAEYGTQTPEILFSGLVNKKIIQVLLKRNGLHPQENLAGEKQENDGGRGVPQAGGGKRRGHGARVVCRREKELRRVFEELRSFPVKVSAANPFPNAQVCAGGVPLREVTAECESRLCPGLYLTGELLDVDGRCGGYNLQWAWTSGHLAGESAARSLV